MNGIQGFVFVAFATLLGSAILALFIDTKDGCKSFWGHDYQDHTEEEDGHKVSYKWCWKCGHRKNDRYEENLSDEYEIYMITGPFGILYNKLTGSLRGSSEGALSFSSGSISGSFNSNLEEKYIVKYMDGNELKTMTFDAKTKSLVVDGKFCLENSYRIAYKKDEEGKWVERTRYGYKPRAGWGDSCWIIHVPELPDVGKMTSSFNQEVR